MEFDRGRRRTSAVNCNRAVAVPLRTFNQTYAKYGLWGSFRLLGDLIATRIFWSGARIVRRPFYVRGRRWMTIGPGLTSGPGLRLDAFPADHGSNSVLKVGHDVQVNDYVHIAAVQSVSIGDRVLIASKVFVSDHNHGSFRGDGPHESPSTPPIQRALSIAPVFIGDDVWIGEGVAILPGVSIGRGSVIGAMSVVTRDVTEFSVAAGSPARVLKTYNFATSAWEKI